MSLGNVVDARNLAHKREWVFTTGLIVLDVLLIALSAFIAVRLRSATTAFGREAPDVAALVVPVASILVVVWILGLAGFGTYERKRLSAGIDEYKLVFNASLIVALTTAALSYLFGYPLSRGFFIYFFLIGIPLLILGRAGFRRVMHRMFRSGKFLSKVLISGNPYHVEEMIDTIRENSWLGYKPVGILLPTGPEGDRVIQGIPVVGRPSDVRDAVIAHDANVVIFADGSVQRARDLNYLAAELESLPVNMIVAPALTNIANSRIHVRPISGMPLVHVDRPTTAKASSTAKRLFDILGSLLAIIVSAPVMAAIAIAIKLDDGGPIMFRQERVGFKGKTFECLKFRSMVTDAEKLRLEMEDMNESEGGLFKVKNDPRITPVGRFIRRYSLDELPQFFNILRGDMSVVGPRPSLPREVAVYEQHVMRRLEVRPGLTGLWQVSGRSDLSWDESVRLDLYYVNNWSLLQDLSIVIRTVRAVVAGSGAY